MSDEYRKRVAGFISKYIDTTNGRKYEDDEVIKQSIRILVTEKVFSVDDLQKTAIKESLVFIPRYFIRDCVYG